MSSLDTKLRVIYWSIVVALVIFGVHAIIAHQLYILDVSIFIVAATTGYYYRKRILLCWEGALFLGLGMLMNTGGTFGAYNLYWNGIGWDKLLHIVSCIGIALLVYAYLLRKHKFSAGELALLTVLIVAGIGCIGKLIEFAGSRLFGFSTGFLASNDGTITHLSEFDKYDTEWDLIANVVGGLLGVAYAHWQYKE